MMLLHGFDGSCTEFRRLKPLLDPHVQTWAVDLLGNGFCGSGLEGRPDADLGPQQRREHLFALWQQQACSFICQSRSAISLPMHRL